MLRRIVVDFLPGKVKQILDFLLKYDTASHQRILISLRQGLIVLYPADTVSQHNELFISVSIRPLVKITFLCPNCEANVIN